MGNQWQKRVQDGLLQDMAKAAVTINRFVIRHKVYEILVEESASRGETLAARREMAKGVNELCRSSGLAVSPHGVYSPSALLVIDDKKSGKFVLENSRTKKRSLTTSDPKALFWKITVVSLNPLFSDLVDSAPEPAWMMENEILMFPVR